MKIYNEITLAWNESTQRYDIVLYEDSFHYTGQLDLVAWGDDQGCSGSYLNCMIFSNPGEQWACPLEYATWCEGNSSMNGACNNISNGIPCNIIDNSADCIAPCSWDDGEEGEQTLYRCNSNGTCTQSSSGEWESWANCMAECEEDEPDPPDYLWKCFDNGLCELALDGTFVTAGQCDAACEPAVYGCTDNTASNWKYNCDDEYVGNPTHDDGCCEYIGCTDNTACNYDDNALEDDGSCNFQNINGVGQSCGCDNGNAVGLYSTICFYDDVYAPGNISGTFETEVTIDVCLGEPCESLGALYSSEQSDNSPPSLYVSIT